MLPPRGARYPAHPPHAQAIADSPLLGMQLRKPRKKISIMIVGNHSAGKSSFINWWVGPTRAVGCVGPVLPGVQQQHNACRTAASEALGCCVMPSCAVPSVQAWRVLHAWHAAMLPECMNCTDERSCVVQHAPWVATNGTAECLLACVGQRRLRIVGLPQLPCSSACSCQHGSLDACAAHP